MKYTLARLREKIQSIRGTVTVDGVVKTTAADFEIHAGVLTKYHGANTRIVIPNGVKAIAEGCFHEQERCITSVTLPEGVQTISSGTFRNFPITEIRLPDFLTQLASGAFSQCSQLRKINIPKGIAKIENGVFRNYTALEQVTFPQNLKVIGISAFTSVVFHNAMGKAIQHIQRRNAPKRSTTNKLSKGFSLKATNFCNKSKHNQQIFDFSGSLKKTPSGGLDDDFF